MRTSLAIAMGVCLGIGVAASAFLIFDRSRPSTIAPVERTTPAIDPATRATQPITTRDAASIAPLGPRSVPVTPVYGRPPVDDAAPADAAARPIYRCRTIAGTTYTHEPCANGTVVDESGAVSGFDSRPSERLGRLVAQGREPEPPVLPSTAGATRRAIAPGDSVECRNLRRQIRDLDAEALRPNTLRSLDELRDVRRDVQTSMTRSRC